MYELDFAKVITVFTQYVQFTIVVVYLRAKMNETHSKPSTSKRD